MGSSTDCYPLLFRLVTAATTTRLPLSPVVEYPPVGICHEQPPTEYERYRTGISSPHLEESVRDLDRLPGMRLRPRVGAVTYASSDVRAVLFVDLLKKNRLDIVPRR